MMIEKVFPISVSTETIAQTFSDLLSPHTQPAPLQVARALLAAVRRGEVFYLEFLRPSRRPSIFIPVAIAARRRDQHIRVGIWAPEEYPGRVVYQLPNKFEALRSLCPEETERLTRIEKYCRARFLVRNIPKAVWAHYWPFVRQYFDRAKEANDVIAVVYVPGEPGFEPQGLRLIMTNGKHRFLHRSGIVIPDWWCLLDNIRRIFLRLEADEITREEAEAELVIFSLEVTGR